MIGRDSSPYDKAKYASIAGLGYFAWTNPQGTARAAIRILGATIAEQVGTWKKVTNIVKEELLLPELAKQAPASARPAAGSIWSVSPWIPFVLFGGAIVQAWENVGCTLTGDLVYGCEPESSGGLLNAV